MQSYFKLARKNTEGDLIFYQMRGTLIFQVEDDINYFPMEPICKWKIISFFFKWETTSIFYVAIFS